MVLFFNDIQAKKKRFIYDILCSNWYYNVALTDYIKSGMANVRLGLFFPVKKLDSFDLTLNIFWDYNFYNAKKPIFYGVNEKPGELTYNTNLNI